MKIEFPLLASLILIGMTLLARVQAQGIEQALLTMAIEYSVNGVRSTVRLLPFAR